jgi:hypothetical protein
VVVRIGNHQISQPHELIALVRRYDLAPVTVVYKRGPRDRERDLAADSTTAGAGARPWLSGTFSYAG